EAVVAETVASGRMSGEPRAIAQSIWAAAHGVVSLMITKTYFPWADRQLVVDTTLDAVFTGLLKP
ncbi:TetR-like C-terminal domain-containing protein, partial [Brevundimonas nasdae]